MKRLLLVAVMCVSFGDEAGSAQRASPYQVFADLRSMSCYSWSPRPPSGQGLSVEEWLRNAPEHAWTYGYMAGAGYMPSQVWSERITPIDVRLVDAWMDQYCARHQSATIEDALRALLKELDARR